MGFGVGFKRYYTSGFIYNRTSCTPRQCLIRIPRARLTKKTSALF